MLKFVVLLQRKVKGDKKEKKLVFEWVCSFWVVFFFKGEERVFDFVYLDNKKVGDAAVARVSNKKKIELLVGYIV